MKLNPNYIAKLKRAADSTPKSVVTTLPTSAPIILPPTPVIEAPRTELITQVFNVPNVITNSKTLPPLYPFQAEALDKAIALIDSDRSFQLVAPTGSGKTYLAGHILHYKQQTRPTKHPILWITKPSIVPQSTRVMLNDFHIKNLLVMSYPQMVTTLGRMYIEWYSQIVNQEVVMKARWKDHFKPQFILCDESHSLKNIDSQQSLIMQAAADENIQSFFMSATPYSRPIHTRVIACALKPMINYGGFSKQLTYKEFPSWVSTISRPSTPLEWCPKAMRKITEVLEPYTLRFGKLTYQKKTIIKQIPCQFRDNASRQRYLDRMEEYKRKRIQFGLDPSLGYHEVLVAQGQFQEQADIERAPDSAGLAFEIEKSNKSVIVACKYKSALDIVHEHLLRRGILDSEISFIRGGQEAQERQRNIDRFQNGKARFLLLMFEAGGAGLSLHHHLSNQRPRVVIIPFVWNSESFVQVLGRAHRINSISTTYQYVMYFEGTIEEEVRDKVRGKCSALIEVVKKGEAWVKAFDEVIGGKSVETVPDDEELDVDSGLEGEEEL